MRVRLESALGILNGAIGDYLCRTQNGLALPMECILEGRAVALDRDSLRAAYPEATPRVAVLVHGLMGTEAAWTFPDGTDYGTLLQRDLGFTPVYVRYNSGLAIPDNGQALCALLDQLVANYPVPIEEILLIGYSMGGLVIRSACHMAILESSAWPRFGSARHLRGYAAPRSAARARRALRVENSKSDRRSVHSPRRRHR